MGTTTLNLQAPNQQQLETMITGYIGQGFTVANRSPASVTLIKHKQFSIIWAVIGFFFCLFPLLIYLIVYASQSDQMVIISVAGAQPTATVSAASPNQLTAPRSPDGNYWWDGQTWQPVNPGASGAQQPALLAGQSTGPLAAGTPIDMASAPRSPDGNYWWDGQAWQLVNVSPVNVSPELDPAPVSDPDQSSQM